MAEVRARARAAAQAFLSLRHEVKQQPATDPPRLSRTKPGLFATLFVNIFLNRFKPFTKKQRQPYREGAAEKAKGQKHKSVLSAERFEVREKMLRKKARSF
jgi:hypothetical protein